MAGSVSKHPLPDLHCNCGRILFSGEKGFSGIGVLCCCVWFYKKRYHVFSYDAVRKWVCIYRENYMAISNCRVYGADGISGVCVGEKMAVGCEIIWELEGRPTKKFMSWGASIMEKTKWILCPVCGSKTRDKIREDTVLRNYPLYCPKCRQESLIEAEDFHITVIKEPDA